LYPENYLFVAVQPQTKKKKDIGDSTISRVSAHEGVKNGSPTV
jgi:hypothetical protein